MTIINSRSILLYATMGFMRGIAPIRRTTKYLTNCPLVFKPRVKVIDFFKNVLLLWVEPPSWLGKLWSVVSVFFIDFFVPSVSSNIFPAYWWDYDISTVFIKRVWAVPTGHTQGTPNHLHLLLYSELLSSFLRFGLKI